MRPKEEGEARDGLESRGVIRGQGQQDNRDATFPLSPPGRQTHGPAGHIYCHRMNAVVFPIVSTPVGITHLPEGDVSFSGIPNLK